VCGVAGSCHLIHLTALHYCICQSHGIHVQSVGVHDSVVCTVVSASFHCSIVLPYVTVSIYIFRTR